MRPVELSIHSRRKQEGMMRSIEEKIFNLLDQWGRDLGFDTETKDVRRDISVRPFRNGAVIETRSWGAFDVLQLQELADTIPLGFVLHREFEDFNFDGLNRWFVLPYGSEVDEGLVLEAGGIRSESKEDTKYEKAKELFGDKFFGPDKIDERLGIKVEEVPPIPFDMEELEKAAENGYVLLLRVDKSTDGHKLNMDHMMRMHQSKHSSDVFVDSQPFRMLRSRNFILELTCRSGWALVNLDFLRKISDYVEQSIFLIEEAEEMGFEKRKNSIQTDKQKRDIRILKPELLRDRFTKWQFFDQLKKLNGEEYRPSIADATYDVLLLFKDFHEILSGSKIVTNIGDPAVTRRRGLEPVYVLNIEYSELERDATPVFRLGMPRTDPGLFGIITHPSYTYYSTTSSMISTYLSYAKK